MNRIQPLDRDQLPDSVRPILEYSDVAMGFTANDVLVMARWPELLQAMSAVVGTVFVPGEVAMELKRLVGLIASSTAGCQYCTAHNAFGLDQDGVAADKQAAAWEFETSPLFSAAERAAMRFARGAAQVPSGVSDEEFADLKRHFTEQQILEITAVVGLFGFLNRWNAALATPLETEPLAHARAQLESHGWSVGPHDPDAAE